MPRLSVELLARCCCGQAKRRREESLEAFLARVTHLYCAERGLEDMVRVIVEPGNTVARDNTAVPTLLVCSAKQLCHTYCAPTLCLHRFIDHLCSLTSPSPFLTSSCAGLCCIEHRLNETVLYTTTYCLRLSFPHFRTACRCVAVSPCSISMTTRLGRLQGSPRVPSHTCICRITSSPQCEDLAPCTD